MRKPQLMPLAAALAITLPTTGLTQEQTSFALEEVIVTAQKRAESLQEVPSSISAFGAEDIENAGWGDIDQLQHAMPSVAVGGESLARPYVFIRGIGTRKFDIGTDGSIGVFVDEIYNARFSNTLTGILDLERVEVLKGPQGTLYGRNTIGGAINMITRKPANEFEGKLKGAIGNDGYYLASGSFSGALLEEKLLARLSLATTDADGIYKDTVSGKDDNNHNQSARLTLLATPNNLEVSFTAEVNQVDSDAQLAEPLQAASGITAASPMLIMNGSVAAAVADNQKNRYSNAFTDPGFLERDSNLLALKVKWMGETVDFTSITSRSDEDYQESRDLDATVLDIWNHSIEQASTQYSQEFRFNSVEGGAFTFDDRLQWVTGIYYFSDDASRIDVLPFGPDSRLAPSLAPIFSGGLLSFPGLEYNASGSDVEIETQSYAIYGQATYAITPDLSLTLGLRYTDDEKEYTYGGITNTPLFPPLEIPFSVGDTLNYSSTDPKITLDYQLADDVMVYASYATGFKSGGVQFQVTTPEAARQSFDEETLTMLEVGLKSQWWHQRLQFNAALYRYNYEDQQVQSIIAINGSPTGLTQNAGESTMNGFEADVIALLAPGLTVNFSYTFQDAEFDEFDSIDGDRAGNKMAYAPEHAVSVGFNYTLSLESGGELSFQGNYAWKDDYYFDFDNSPDALQESYGVINLAAWWDLADGKTRIRAFCNNCGDEDYLNNVAIFPDVIGGGGRQSWATPRRYGLELTYTF
ncbi:TonB-dependent receptor [Pseudomaricurvus alkylphenolicus]|uniref:TonB-dependent receptor n=1 Tax=Pseudomaricurvus alkylphenolicus TaxID=1306991 RepID=UPI001423347C|nr:TonB-dependent receptor [Pseudomaricurvus alkylphenolicus]NIB40971.1 TonB-dependent receptor [Pseudomaricurvus alkylphenolicus]